MFVTNRRISVVVAVAKQSATVGQSIKPLTDPTIKHTAKGSRKVFFVLGKDEEALRAHPGDMDTPPNAFEEAVGQFWAYKGTRNYMKSRNELVHVLLDINTKQAVESALEHSLDIMRLNPEDFMYVRRFTPSLFLRLGRDQECYVFCKFWVTKGHDERYGWDDHRPAHVIMKGSNAFEPVVVFESVRNFEARNDFMVPSFSDVSNLVAVTLVKIRLLLDLKALQRRKEEVGHYTPHSELDNFRNNLTSSIVADSHEILEREDQAPYIKELEKLTKKLYEAVNRANKHFWPALLQPRNNLTVKPYLIGMGDEVEMQTKLQECYNAWVETPGAIGIIEKLSQE